MADALLSTPVAVVADAIAVTLIVVAGKKVAKSPRENIVALMGVLGACVFAAQMVNFSIPGTGSSGHIIGGVFLAALIGPWAAFLTLSSVLIVQCLIFADGGLLALGCNILNMAAMSCLVAYPLIFKPLIRQHPTPARLMFASVLTCVVALEGGAVLVTAETSMSGVTALSTMQFLGLMTSIHFAIGICEGVATGAILWFVQKARPDLLEVSESSVTKHKIWKTAAVFGICALVIAGIVSLYASSDPDGLEWSIAKITGATELAPSSAPLASAAQSVQTATAIMPDYENTFSGIVGTLMVLTMLWVVCAIVRRPRQARDVKD